MKKILVISSSLRKDSNSEALADEFIRGARAAGYEAEKILLRDRTINFCRGCLACQQTLHCVIHDDANAIVEKMKDADVVVFATPVYYYEMSGQLKTMLDRANPLYPADYRFRDIYLLASAAEEDASAVDGTIHGLEGWIKCFEKARLAGVVRGTGVTAPGEMRGRDAILKQAYDLGRQA